METELEMAERHVREGEAHVARQRDLVAELRRDGHDTEQAEQLLTTFEATLAQHRKGLELVKAHSNASRSSATSYNDTAAKSGWQHGLV